MDSVAAPNAKHRERVIAFLAFLTSEDCHLACLESVQPEQLAAALTRLWFDEIYLPGENGVDGPKPIPEPDELAQFRASFSSQELASLARFHGFFELRLNFLTNQVKGRAFFPENDSWRGILNHAVHVLGELAPDPDRLRATLVALARGMESGSLVADLRENLTLPDGP